MEGCFSSLNFSFPTGEELIGYPVAGANGSVEVGDRRFNIMWYRPVAAGAELRDFFTGIDGVHYETGIPPQLVRPELISAMKEEAHQLLPPIFANVIERMDGMFVQAIYDLRSERMGKGRVAIIGDAAFVARPHCGAGVAKAADDAVALATALELTKTLKQPSGDFRTSAPRRATLPLIGLHTSAHTSRRTRTGRRLRTFRSATNQSGIHHQAYRYRVIGGPSLLRKAPSSPC